MEKWKSAMSQVSWPLPLTNKTNALFDLIDATTRNQTRGLRYETIHIGLTAFPVMYGHIADIADVAECRERRVQE